MNAHFKPHDFKMLEFNPDGDLISLPNIDRSQIAALGKLPSVIAFTGLAGSGKSTASQMLVDVFGYKRHRFAGPLKSMMAAIGFDQDHIEGKFKETPNQLLDGKTPRYAMQTLGTEWGRKLIGEDVWVNLWEDAALETLLCGTPVVVDDCRFPNEAGRVRQLGGMVIKIVGRGGIAGDHASEQGCGIVDAIIENDGDIDALHSKVIRAVGRLN